MARPLLVPVFLVACTAAPAEPGPALVADPGAPKAPFVLAVEGPTPAPDGTADVTVTIARAWPSTLPIVLHVAAPVGLQLVQGRTDETLVEEGPAITRVFRVVVRDPGAALAVTASLAADAMGAHARREVRFDGAGEPAPPPARPGGRVQPER
jgi:hypothetical protein